MAEEPRAIDGDQRAGDLNVRQLLQLLGDQGVLKQGADGELLVSFLNTELGFSIDVAVTSLASIDVSSMPTLTTKPVVHTKLATGLLTDSAVTLYTAAADWRDVEIYLANVGTGAYTAQLSLGTLGDATSLIKNYPMVQGYRMFQRLPYFTNAEIIQGLCSTSNKVSYQIWGIAV